MNKTTILSCNQLLDIFSASHIATAIYTSNNLIIEAATDAMISIWGKERKDVIGNSLIELLPELKGQPFIGMLQNVLKTGVSEIGVGTPAQLLLNGKLETRYYDFEYKALKNNDGEIYCILHHASDVTERILGLEAIQRENEKDLILLKVKSLNEELAATVDELQQTQDSLHQLNTELELRVESRTKQLSESEESMRYMIKDAPVAISLLKGKEMLVESANEFMLKLWGKSADMVGSPLIAGMPELVGQPFLDLLDKVFTSGEPFFGQEMKAVIENNGVENEIFSNFVYKPLTNEAGITEKIIIVATDVTEQVLARKQIEAVKKRFQEMVGNTPIGMTILKGNDFIIEQANQPIFNLWQKTKEETIGRKILEVFPELLDQPFPEMLTQVFETGQRFALPEILVKMMDKQGILRERYVDFSYDPLFDEDGNVEAILVTVLEITEVVATRKALEQSEIDLQNTTEELATTNEELYAINEEMVVSNEELSSSNQHLIEIQDSLKNSLLQLKESEQRFRFLLNAMPQQVWTANPQGAIDYVNDVVSSDFGYSKEEIIGAGWQKFIHPDDLPKALKSWINSLETGEEYLVEFRLLFNDNTYKWHLARAVPLIENNEIKLWLGTNTNIDLQKSNEQRKDEFLSIASHELKTPLTSIKAFNQLMKRTNDADRLYGFVNKSADHIRRLERLISDLLDVTKINSGKMEYNSDSFNFKQLLKDSCENAQQVTTSHQIIIEHNVDIDFKGDYFRLEQVMNNFLTNAVKYSPDGEKVIVSSKIEDDSIVVCVKDFGIGISPAHINKLFDRYYRVDNTAMRFEGLGLGLFITSEIIKRHQGKFWIESELGKGSTFCFKLPIL